MSQDKNKKHKSRRIITVIAILTIFSFVSWWGYWSSTQPPIPTTSTLGLSFYANMGKGCLKSNPKTREIFASYNVTVGEVDNIPVQYEATYATVTSVTYSDNRVSPIGIFPKQLVHGPVYGASETIPLNIPVTGTTYGRPNATVIGGPILFLVLIQDASGRNSTYLAESPSLLTNSLSGQPTMFSTAWPNCEI